MIAYSSAFSKTLGFLNSDGAPQPRYFEFSDRTRSKQVLAQAIRGAFSKVFAFNTRANELSVEEVKSFERCTLEQKRTL